MPSAGKGASGLVTASGSHGRRWTLTQDPHEEPFCMPGLEARDLEYPVRCAHGRDGIPFAEVECAFAEVQRAVMFLGRHDAQQAPFSVGREAAPALR